MTSVPFFDIDFESILRFATKSADKINIKFIDEHLDLIKDIFGLRNLSESIIHLKNQSIIPLGSLWCDRRVHLPRSRAAAET